MFTVNPARLRVLIHPDFSVALRFFRLGIVTYRTSTGFGVIIPIGLSALRSLVVRNIRSWLSEDLTSLPPPTLLRRYGFLSPCQQLGP